MNTEFYEELKKLLPYSLTAHRRIWAVKIVHEEIPIQELIGLLQCEEPVASRFLWLISDIGVAGPLKLQKELPYLLKVIDPRNNVRRATSFANFWILAGVPEENETQAIQLLFEWLSSAKSSVTLKARAATVLLELCKKYPELKHELKLTLESQIDHYTEDFKRKSKEILNKISLL